jgi:peptidoglycan hydrolase-like protein with peptidoglycan-binding domain
MTRLVGFGAALLLAVAPAAAQEPESERMALLIGNADYEHAPEAQTAARDVDAVAEALRGAGWEVTALTDLDRAGMRTAFERFAEESDDAEDVLIYYSGHALRTGGETYIAPTDQEAGSLVAVLFDAVPLSLAMRIAEGASGQGVLLIDGAQLDGFEPTPFVEPGLAQINPPENVFVVSAAPPGQAIRRSPGRDSRFAQLLVDQFTQPGAGLLETANEVGSPIWVAGTTDAGFALAPEEAPLSEAGDDEIEREIELAYWRTAERTGRAEDYRAYLERYPDGVFAEFARDRLDLDEDEPLPERPRVDPDLEAENAMNLSRGRVRQVQSWLDALGHNVGSVDGLMGPQTRSALRDWERANDREVNGYISSAELDLLQQQGETALAEQDRRETEQRRIAEAEDNGYWAATGADGTAAGYRAYLERFPEGLHAEAARAALQAMAEAESDEALRVERAAFRMAQNVDTPDAWRDYLAEYPNGAFRDEALARLDAIEGAERDAARLERAERIEADLGLNQRDMLSVEQRLRSLGFEPGPLDGRFDRQTRAAITNYQTSRAIEPTGYLDRQTLVGIVQETTMAGAGQPGQLVIDGTQVIRSLLGAFGQAVRNQ